MYPHEAMQSKFFYLECFFVIAERALTLLIKFPLFIHAKFRFCFKLNCPEGRVIAQVII
jgi:hypothetical protein